MSYMRKVEKTVLENRKIEEELKASKKELTDLCSRRLYGAREVIQNVRRKMIRIPDYNYEDVGGLSWATQSGKKELSVESIRNGMVTVSFQVPGTGYTSKPRIIHGEVPVWMLFASTWQIASWTRMQYRNAAFKTLKNNHGYFKSSYEKAAKKWETEKEQLERRKLALKEEEARIESMAEKLGQDKKKIIGEVR